MKLKTEEMYATMSPWRLFFAVAAPGMISMFAMSIYSIVEGIFIGQTLGEYIFATEEQPPDFVCRFTAVAE